MTSTKVECKWFNYVLANDIHIIAFADHHYINVVTVIVIIIVKQVEVWRSQTL